MLSRNIPIVVKVWCFLKRPKEDFIGRRRAAGNLRLAAVEKDTVVAIKPDVDNLAKFVLDSLTGVLFADDAQIVDLHMYKLRDSHGLCEGRVAIHVSQFGGGIQTMMPWF